MAHTADRLRAITAEHGPGAVSAYIGNPTAFNALGVAAHRTAAARARRAADVLVGHAGLRQQVRRQRGRVRLVDRAPDPRPRAHRPVPDHRREPAGLAGQLLLDPQRARRAAPGHRRAGARIVFVNPRRIETPDRGVGDTVLIRPDTDVWFLAALLHEIDRARRVRRRGHRPPRHARRGAAGVPRRVPGRPGRRRHRHRRRRRSASSPRRGSPRRGRRSTPRPASTWAARARSPTGSCTCSRSSPGASTSRAATSRATGSTPTPGPAPACPEQGYVDTEFGPAAARRAARAR